MTDLQTMIRPAATQSLRDRVFDALFADLYPGVTATRIEGAVDRLFAEGVLIEPTSTDQWGVWPVGYATPLVAAHEAEARAMFARHQSKGAEARLVSRPEPAPHEADYTGWTVVAP